jgi:hypothetical protein
MVLSYSLKFTAGDIAVMNVQTINLLEVETKAQIYWCDMSHLAAELLLARLALDELRISHPESTPSNVKAVYMSPWKSHLLNTKLHPICNSVIHTVKQICKDFWNTDMEGLNLDFLIADCWGVTYEQSDKTIIHSHFPSDFSAVIYLDADDDSAPIIFEEKLLVKPKPNTLIIFPGYLRHEVPENNGKRTVLAMNLNKIPSFNHPSV